MATLVGKVGIVMKGDWSSSATYETLDAVGYNGGTYIAKQNVPANTVPTNTTYWQLAVKTNRINLGQIAANSETTFTLPEGNKNYLISIENTYGAGLCGIILCASSAMAYQAIITSTFFTFSAVNGTQFKITSTSANGNVIVTQI